jgi:hypothetical protein
MEVFSKYHVLKESTRDPVSIVLFLSRAKDIEKDNFNLRVKDSNTIHKTQVPFTLPMSKTPAVACDGQVRVSLGLTIGGVRGCLTPRMFLILFLQRKRLNCIESYSVSHRIKRWYLSPLPLI